VKSIPWSEAKFLPWLEPYMDRRMVPPGDVKKYSEDQPRDEAGRWTAGADSSDPSVVAAAVYAKAAAAEPAITGSLQGIADATGGNLNTAFIGPDGVEHHTLEARLKTPGSTERKIRDDMKLKQLSAADAGKQVFDGVRYTMTYPKPTYADGVHTACDVLKAAGYEPLRGRDAWGHENGYSGVNTLWADATGQVFEVQFHTEESLQFKEGVGHAFYEQQRSEDPGSPAWLAAQEKIDAGWATVRADLPYLDHLNDYIATAFPKH